MKFKIQLLTKIKHKKTHKPLKINFIQLALPLLLAVFVTQASVIQPAIDQQPDIRVATFNVSMDATNYLPNNKIGSGVELIAALKDDRQQIKNIAEIIQRNRPDIILLNEFDYIADPKQGVEIFLKQYLGKSQQGIAAIDYPYYYFAPVNTGVSTPFDLDNNGKKTNNLGDAQGYGHFPGHFGMLVLSKYPIDEDNIRTFQHFLWKDMPNAIVPINPSTKEHWYNEQEWQMLRLSSKSHWDIPINVQGKLVHILASHPTPPVFDGEEDRNGARNHDEIRFWQDYITPNKGNYIYDDQGGKGGLTLDSRFVILGDQNASKDEGAARKEGISNLLASPFINNDMTPASVAAIKNSNSPFAANHTAGWGMQADYVLPSRLGINLKNNGVFWPKKDSPLYRLIETRSASSDHRLVWADLILTAKDKLAKNIIMVIGDGMGPAYTTGYRYYMDNINTPQVETTIFDKLLTGMVSTYPVNSQGYVTDSAAAATALSTGYKTYNGAIGVDVNKKPLLTLMERAKQLGKKTGLVVTSQINHATPAAYFSHNESRKNYNEIADSYFDDKINGHFKANLMLGGGSKYFIRPDRNLVSEFKQADFQYIDDLSKLTSLNKQQPVLGLFAEVGLPWTLDNKNENHLLAMAKAGVRHLENNEGYVLLVEASQIDWAGHSNDIAAAMAEMQDLAETLTWLKNYVENRDDTLLVATADHSTGGLTLGANGDYRWQPEFLKNLTASPKSIATKLAHQNTAISAQQLTDALGFIITDQEANLFIGRSDEKSIYEQIKLLIDSRTNTGWTSGGHTGIDVQVFATGNGAKAFNRHQTNTDIAKQLFLVLEGN
ncbi:alkaline phosphatase [Colwellia sp. MB3u-55]|nr:alkaline phosphatase [Colwellia sp. MB3u-55]